MHSIPLTQPFSMLLYFQIILCFCKVFSPYRISRVSLSASGQSNIQPGTSLTEAMIVKTTPDLFKFYQLISLSKPFTSLTFSGNPHNLFHLQQNPYCTQNQPKISRIWKTLFLYGSIQNMYSCHQSTHIRQNNLVCSDPLIILTDQGPIADLLQVLHI